MLQRKFHFFSPLISRPLIELSIFYLNKKSLWRATTQQIKMINLKSLRSFMKHENNSFKAHHASINFFFEDYAIKSVPYVRHILRRSYEIIKFQTFWALTFFAYKFIFMLFLFLFLDNTWVLFVQVKRTSWIK